MQIGIIGSGAIATFLLEALEEQQIKNIQVKSILVRNLEKYAYLEDFGVTLYTDIHEFLQSPIDFVVEAATVEVVREVVPIVLQQKDLILISIGALVDEELLEQLKQIATEHKRSLYLPSGAIGGLDLLQNAQALNGVDEVTLTTRKPAHTLTDESLQEEKVIFSGSARDAIEKLPKNVNVAIVLSLAGIGMDRTKVEVIADPLTDKNTHQISITGEFGSAEIIVNNNPLPSNPRTSYLAAISILEMCLRRTNVIQIA